MRQFKLSLSLLLATFLFLTCKNSDTSITIPTKKVIQSDTISMVLTEANNWIVETIINQVDTLDLMFHTAATDVALKQSVLQRMQSTNLSESDTITSWGGKHESRYSMINRVQISEQSWDSIMIIEDIHSGPDSDGKFGYNLFEGKVVQLDFVNGHMIIHDELPVLEEGFQSLEMIKGKPSPFITAQVAVGDSLFSNEFMLHSGYGGTVLLDDDFVRLTQIDQYLEIVGGRDLKDSFGNIIKTQKVIIPDFKIGKESFKDVTVEIFDVALGRQKLSVLGGGILKQLDIIFDFQTNTIYVKANELKEN